MDLGFTGQTFLHFDADALYRAGFRTLYVYPSEGQGRARIGPDEFIENLGALKAKAERVNRKYPDLRIHVMTFTIFHPEGNYLTPERYKLVVDIEGNQNPQHVCWLSEPRRGDLLSQYAAIAGLGFERVLIDDDMRNTDCYCKEHLKGCAPFDTMNRKELIRVATTHNPTKEDMKLRRRWLSFRRRQFVSFMKDIERAMHAANPKCRIGFCSGAYPCNCTSGFSDMTKYETLSGPEAPSFMRLPAGFYVNDIRFLAQSLALATHGSTTVPPQTERIAEVTMTYAHNIKHSSYLLLETLAHSLLTTTTTHIAWTEDFAETGFYDVVKRQSRRIRAIKDLDLPPAVVRGLRIWVPDKTPEYYGTHPSEIPDAWNAYRGLAYAGLPVRLCSDIPRKRDLSQPLVAVGRLPRVLLNRVLKYVRAGGVALFDGPATASFAQKGLLKSLGITSGVAYEVLDGERISQVSYFKPDSILPFDPAKGKKGCREITALISGNGERIGSGSALCKLGKGRIVCMAHDLIEVDFRICAEPYRNLLRKFLQLLGVRLVASAQGEALVQCCPFVSKSRKVIVLVNHSSESRRVRLEGTWIKDGRMVDLLTGRKVSPDSVAVKPLDVRALGCL